MATERVERRLAAILAADVVGYSRLIGADESGTLAAFKTIKSELFDPTSAANDGRLVKTTGDGFLVEFSSVVDALLCATEFQTQMVKRNAAQPTDRLIEFRIGINVGDIVVENGDVFGDGVNVAVRLEALAAPGGICVSERVQEDAEGKLDLVFEDIGEQHLKNIVRPVRVYRVAIGGVAETARGRAPFSLPDCPSIAVLPFTNMSGDLDQEFFADGIAEDIITALSRYPSLFVIARNSCFTYKGRAVDVKQVGRDLGVRYVLEGSLRKAGDRIRVTGQLVEAETGRHFWADRYDRELTDIFALQDEITGAVTIAIAPAIADAERKRAMRKPPESLDAWTAYQRGRGMSSSSVRTMTPSQRSTFSRPSISIPPSPAATRASLLLTSSQPPCFRRAARLNRFDRPKHWHATPSPSTGPMRKRTRRSLQQYCATATMKVPWPKPK